MQKDDRGMDVEESQTEQSSKPKKTKGRQVELWQLPHRTNDDEDEEVGD